MGLGFALAGAAALIPAVSAQIRVAKATAAKGYNRLRLSVVGLAGENWSVGGEPFAVVQPFVQRPWVDRSHRARGRPSRSRAAARAR